MVEVEGSSPSEDDVGGETTPAPLLDMLDLDTVADEAEPDVSLERSGYGVTLTVAVDGEIDLDQLCEMALAVLMGEGAPKGKIDLHLVDAETVQDLNKVHIGSDEPTDVLAFPLDPDAFDAASIDDGLAMLGDIVICPSVAFAQAPGHTGSFEAEMLLLTVHGTLHILGHDHGETDERLLMQSRERHHLAALDLLHPVPAP